MRIEELYNQYIDIRSKVEEYQEKHHNNLKQNNYIWKDTPEYKEIYYKWMEYKEVKEKLIKEIEAIIGDKAYVSNDGKIVVVYEDSEYGYEILITSMYEENNG